MGLRFGELGVKIRGIIYYRISPFEQRAFAGALTKGIPNTYRRIRGSFFRVAPPFIIGYLVYEAAEREHYRLSRKNPADYENDE